MSSLSEITKRIEEINKLSKQLNNERAVNIGKREALEKQLQDAVHTYNETYNSSLDVSRLDEEIERVVADKEKEVENIEGMLALIREGRYDEAQALAGGKETNGVVNSSTNLTANTPVVSTQNVPNVDSPAVSPVMGVTNGVVPPVMETPHGVVNTTESPVVPPPVAPPVIGKPSTPDNSIPAPPPTSFNAILGGSMFKPQ